MARVTRSSKTVSLLNEMRACSVLLDSADVVRYFCGVEGQYRYQRQLDVPHVYSNYHPSSNNAVLDLPVHENSDDIPMLDIEIPQADDVDPSSNLINIQIDDGVKSDEEPTVDISPVKSVVRCVVIKCEIRNKKGRKRVSKFSCSQCKKTFSNYDFIRRHMRTVHNKPVSCKTCGIFVSDKSKLVKHTCVVRKKKCTYTCEMCAESVKTKRLLKSHVQKHIQFMRPLNKNDITNVKLFSRMKQSEFKKLRVHCLCCGEDIKAVNFFTSHFSQCCQSSNFACPLCGISKYRFDSMTEHLRRHLNFLSKPFSCKSCHFIFLNDINLTSHVGKVHDNDVQSWGSDLTYYSPETTKSDLATDSNLVTDATLEDCNENDLITNNCTIFYRLEEKSIEDSDCHRNKSVKIASCCDKDVGGKNDVPNLVEAPESNKPCSDLADDKNTINVTSDCPKKAASTDIEESKDTKPYNEGDSDNSEKENQVIKIESVAEAVSTENVQKPTQTFTKLSTSISEVTGKLVLKHKCDVLCVPCGDTHSVESYLKHLAVCIANTDFTCSFCNTKHVKRSLEKRWLHIKFHLTRSDTQSVCDMCEQIFLNVFNMAAHAQNTHFM